MRLVLLFSLALLSLPLEAPRAGAVIIASGDGTGNTSAPPDDPGWIRVGQNPGFLSAVYLRNRWVVTANHVGASAITIDGTTYPAIVGSKVRLDTLPADGKADVAVFRLIGDPGLAPLAVASSTPSVGTAVTLIGRGRDRGAFTTWMGIDGWLWAGNSSLRWGTNLVSDDDELVDDPPIFALTQMFLTDFDSGLPTAHESQSVAGDSGGGVFVKNGGTWELAGVISTAFHFENQPAAALYGNASGIADLAYYKSQIDAIVDTPSCSDGLDDDLDGYTDYPADPGCTSLLDPSEAELPIPALSAPALWGLVCVLSASGWVLARRTRRRG